jgi:hypothetical protein
VLKLTFTPPPHHCFHFVHGNQTNHRLLLCYPAFICSVFICRLLYTLSIPFMSITDSKEGYVIYPFRIACSRCAGWRGGRVEADASKIGTWWRRSWIRFDLHNTCIRLTDFEKVVSSLKLVAGITVRVELVGFSLENKIYKTTTCELWKSLFVKSHQFLSQCCKRSTVLSEIIFGVILWLLISACTIHLFTIRRRRFMLTNSVLFEAENIPCQSTTSQC